MKTRIISGIIWTPILVGFIYINGLPLLLMLMGLSLIGQTEFFRAVGINDLNGKYIMYMATVLLYLSEMFFGDNLIIVILLITFLSIFIYFMRTFENIPFESISMYMFSIFYLPVTFLAVYKIRNMNYGIWLIWSIFLIAFSSDTFAYFTGKFLGKRKLAPILSPNKTVEGAIGGILGSMFMMYLYINLMTNYSDLMKLDYSYLIIVLLLSGVGAVISQFGDLCASAIKRQKGVKDYGNLIKGHGGVLDRFDSVIFTTQFLFIVLYLIEVF